MIGPKLFFAFPDQVYDYACSDCTALCCKGGSFGGNMDREMGPLLEKYPALASFTTECRGKMSRFITPKGGCFFLSQNGGCGIEQELGKAAKPVDCSLFPFNVFRRLGDTVIVTPHFFCPLRIHDPRSGKHVAGVHEDLKGPILRSGYVDSDHLHRLPEIKLKKGTLAARILKEEVRFRDLCSEALSSGATFRSVLDRVSSKEISKWLGKRSREFGLTSPSQDPLIDFTLLAVAPVLRVSLLGESPEFMNRLLGLFELQVHELARLIQPRAMTPQEVHGLFSQFREPLAELMRGSFQVVADTPIEVSKRFAVLRRFTSLSAD